MIRYFPIFDGDFKRRPLYLNNRFAWASYDGEYTELNQGVQRRMG